MLSWVEHEKMKKSFITSGPDRAFRAPTESVDTVEFFPCSETYQFVWLICLGMSVYRSYNLEDSFSYPSWFVYYVLANVPESRAQIVWWRFVHIFLRFPSTSVMYPVKIWAQLFKTNDVVSSRIVKILIIKYEIYANSFAAKMWIDLSLAKTNMLLTFFSKSTCKLDIVLTRTFNILTTNELIKLTILWITGPWWLIDK